MKRVLLATLIALSPFIANADPGPSRPNEEKVLFRSYRLCPAWAFKATVGLIADGMSAELAWRRWCYVIEMPLRQNPRHAAEEPEWVIPYDSTSWIAVKTEGGQVIGFENRKGPKAAER